MGNCIATIMSHVMHTSEKFSMWISLCSFVTCMILCLLCMLAFGIGLGYNYSYVDYKSKHVYVAGQYKKTRPTNYHGPGYYRPTTRPARNKPTADLLLREEPEVVEIVNEFPENAPSENAIKLLESAEVMLPLRVADAPRRGYPLKDLYFTVLKTLPTTQLRQARRFNDSLDANTPIPSIKNETGAKFDIAYKSSNQSHHMNTTKDLSGPEAIRVDITSSTNTDNSSIAQTLMNMKQLLSFLTFLREKQKKFNVQVITL